ncbi:uncharacterized protein LOC124941854 [Impatiens glandulifera]|uniref:uncharacterized protein LOC124941854 n=1 Tax=Impatiens glandulifera TaxID=253017 RepID=UPI001FB091E7|nr:uncharacterized protein LOC124941854 [Impatiens glandulifera]
MAKNRNKKNKNTSSMDCTEGPIISSKPQAMDTSETSAPRPYNPDANRPKIKTVVMKKTKNIRKKKSIAKAISRNEQSKEKVLKNLTKTQRTLSAKKLYD